MSMKRWRCPRCGEGKLAPSRPRDDDVRPWCLPCSEKTGRFVKRVAPSLENERAARKEKQTTKAEAKRAERTAQRLAAEEAERVALEQRQRREMDDAAPLYTGHVLPLRAKYLHASVIAATIHYGIIYRPHMSQIARDTLDAAFQKIADGSEGVLPWNALTLIRERDGNPMSNCPLFAWTAVTNAIIGPRHVDNATIKSELVRRLRRDTDRPYLAVIADEIDLTP